MDEEAHNESNANARVHIENDLPFLTYYREQEGDVGIERLARACLAHVVIGSEGGFTGGDFSEISESFLSRFGAFLVLKISSGNDRHFTLRGPVSRLRPEISAFTDKLRELPRVSEKGGWDTLVQDEDVTLGRGLGRTDAVVLSLEIPTEFRAEDGPLYPLFFRAFRDGFADAVRRLAFEFLRLQTRSEVATYRSLGKRRLDHTSLAVDRELAEVGGAYRFLYLVSPTNLAEIKKTFFESGFEKVLPYRNRLLPVDPDLLKRKLFNIRIEDVDDPALGILFHEKREEIEHELTMLSERGSRNFFYTSFRRYRGVEPEVLLMAREILEHVPPTKPEDRNAASVSARDFVKEVKDEFAFFREQAPDFNREIHVRDDVNVLMVSQGDLYVPSRQRLSERQRCALLQHEVGTHILTHFNGSSQPLRMMSGGFADYDPLQEGLAVLSEYFCESLSTTRLRTLAGRVLAGHCLAEGADFREMFGTLRDEAHMPDEEAFDITARMFQGGGFLKDIIYLEGLVKLREYLMEGGEYEPLLAGKFGLKHIPLVAELTERRILKPPVLSPRYLLRDDFPQKLQAVRDGLPLHQMITP